MNHHDHVTNGDLNRKNLIHLSLQATLHCLLGCGLGEIAEMVISNMYNLSMNASVIISVAFGFAAGLALGIIPLVRKNFGWVTAIKIVIISEGLSIAVMEAFELVTQLIIPGVMNAQLNELIFWIGMIVGLAVGFIAAFPVNYYMIKKGVRH